VNYKQKLKTLFEEHEEWDPSKSLGSKSEFGNDSHPNQLTIGTLDGGDARTIVDAAVKKFEKKFEISIKDNFSIEVKRYKADMVGFALEPNNQEIIEWFVSHPKLEEEASVPTLAYWDDALVIEMWHE
jgi:hypothetical protein